MKKFRDVFAEILCLVMLFCVTGCINRDPITADDFKSKMEDKGYNVVDAKEQMKEYDYVEKVYLAIDETGKYQIEFYELSDKDNAKSFFNTNQQIFEDTKSSGGVEATVNMGNYSKYSLTNDGKYKVVARIDNTVIFVNADDQYKTTIKELLDDIGY